MQGGLQKANEHNTDHNSTDNNQIDSDYHRRQK